MDLRQAHVENMIPRNLGVYEADVFASKDAFHQHIKEVCAGVQLQFKMDGRTELQFLVYCTRDPAKEENVRCVYRIGAPDMAYTPNVKDLVNMIVQTTCKAGRAEATVMITEAWMLMNTDRAKVDEIGNKSLEHHPGRIEALLVTGDHARWGSITYSAEIVLIGKDNRQLKPWQMFGESHMEGRFVQDLVPPEAVPGGTA